MNDEPGDQCCRIAPDGQTCAEERPTEQSTCPDCGKRLRRVSAAHVMHQVRSPSGRDIKSTDSMAFCPSHGCAVVYVGGGGERFETGDLRRPPAYKTGVESDLLCYCFDVSGADALSPGGDAFVSFISDRVRDGDCACDVLNPSAGCCLGSIATYRKTRAAGS